MAVRPLCGILFLLLAPLLAIAGQKVTLNSGTVLVGEVSYDGSQVVVAVGESTLRFPIAQVASIASEDADITGGAQQLLLIALEARLKAGGEDHGKDVGFLAEAHRLAPDDIRIAFWYATSLAEAGQGALAKKVFDANREALATAYPGDSDRLKEQIEERIKLQGVPRPMLREIDKINATLAARPPGIRSSRQNYYAILRATDQHGKPLTKAEFGNPRITGGGLREFQQGYFLLTYQVMNGQSPACQLKMDSPDFEPQTYTCTGAPSRVNQVIELQAVRYGKQDKKPLRLKVVDQQGTPVPEATVQVVRAGKSIRGTQPERLTTDGEGVATAEKFPGSYLLSVTAKGYKSTSVTGDVTRQQPTELSVKLVEVISATVRVAYESKQNARRARPGDQAEAQVTKGEGELVMVDGAMRSSVRELSRSLRIAQVESQLALIIAKSRTVTGVGSEEAFVRVIPQAKGESQEEVLRRFREVDLASVDAFKDEHRTPRMVNAPSPRASSSSYHTVEANHGDILFGRLTHRDPRRGGYSTMTFKIVVDKKSKN